MTATTVGALTAGGSVAQPVPPDPAARGFVLFADHGLRTKGLKVRGGTIAVNRGELVATHGALVAPQSDVVADTVRLDRGAQCAALFANTIGRSAPGCSTPQPFTSPLVFDFSAACGFPSEFPSCTPGAPVVLEKGQQQTLPPGSYGELRLKNDATVRLGAGTYVFCTVAAERRAKILTAATTIQVVGDVRLNNAATIGPDAAGLTENDTLLQVAGRVVHFSRQTRVHARLCAPTAVLSLSTGGVHRGCFAAGAIRVSRADVTVCRADTSSTTTTTTTTTTTLLTVTTSQSATAADVRPVRRQPLRRRDHALWRMV